MFSMHKSYLKQDKLDMALSWHELSTKYDRRKDPAKQKVTASGVHPIV